MMTSSHSIISSSPAITPASEPVFLHQQPDKKASFQQLTVQCKLSIGAADDPLEKEADDMADKVMRMKMPGPINFSFSKNTIDRKCAHCEEEEKQLQRKESNG